MNTHNFRASGGKGHFATRPSGGFACDLLEGQRNTDIPSCKAQRILPQLQHGQHRRQSLIATQHRQLKEQTAEWQPCNSLIQRPAKESTRKRNLIEVVEEDIYMRTLRIDVYVGRLRLLDLREIFSTKSSLSAHASMNKRDLRQASILGTFFTNSRLCTLPRGK